MSMRSLLILVIFIPFAVCLTLIEDIYLTKQLMNYFGDDLDENDSTEDGGGQTGSFEDFKIVSLLSDFDTREQVHHYWTRLGHRSQTKTTPVVIWKNYNYNYASNNGYYKRKKRHVKSRSILQRLKRQIESEKQENGMLLIDQRNYTSDLPKPMLDYKMKKGFNKCCASSEESQNTHNEKFQEIKMQCLQEVRRNRMKPDDSSTTIVSDAGLYNIYSCDRVNRWKATVTCTIDCIGQKLAVVNSVGEINIKSAKSVIEENFAIQNWQRDVSDGIIEKCYTEISSNSPNKILEKFGLKCNTRLAEFTYCLWREFFIKCPPEKQQKTRNCEKLRFALKKNHGNKFKN